MKAGLARQGGWNRIEITQVLVMTIIIGWVTYRAFADDGWLVVKIFGGLALLVGLTFWWDIFGEFFRALRKDDKPRKKN